MRRHELWANLVFQLPMIFGLGILLVVIWPINYIVVGTLYAIGLADLVYAKLPLLRHGVLTTFGPSHIPRKRRVAYYRGYTRIVLGVAFNLLVVLYYSVVASWPRAEQNKPLHTEPRAEGFGEITVVCRGPVNGGVRYRKIFECDGRNRISLTVVRRLL